jgi:hypothetical protein
MPRLLDYNCKKLALSHLVPQTGTTRMSQWTYEHESTIWMWGMSKDSEDREPGQGTETSKVQDYIEFYRGVYFTL